MSYTVPPDPNASFFAPDATVPTQGPVTDLEAAFIYEMLGAVYSSDSYLVMDSQGTRLITIGELGSPNQGGLRIGVNTYITANLGNSQLYLLRQYICIWNKVKLSNTQINNGSVGASINGISSSPEDKVQKVLRLVKVLLPAITVAEYKARNSNEGGVSSVNGGGGAGSFSVNVSI